MTKRRLLVCGVGPLPRESSSVVPAPGLRIETLALRLAKEGHEVAVWRKNFIFSEADDPLNNFAEEDFEIDQSFPGTNYPFSCYGFRDDDLRELAQSENKQFDAVFVSTDPVARLVAELNIGLPLHVDYFGDPLSERQLQGHQAGNDLAILDAITAMMPALLAGDRYSVCSFAHVHALHGQLSVVGRFNQHTPLIPLVSEWRPGWSMEFPPVPDGKKVIQLKGNLVPEDAFVIIWSGGYNNWADVEGMFAALEAAMERLPSLYYVSTGGEVPGHALHPFRRFKKLIEESPLKERFVFTGWLEIWEMPGFYAQADAGISFDMPLLEGEFGTRNRLFDWAYSGIPVITTPGSEMARAMFAADAAREIPFEKMEILGGVIAALIDNPEAARKLGERAKTWAHQWMDEAFPQTMLDWAADPRPAPDLPPPSERQGFVAPDNPLSAVFREMFLERGLDQLSEDKGSRLYQLYRKLKKR